MSGVFITGTDTEIGKTFVSSLLIHLLVEEGFQVAGMKPIASGAKIIDGRLKNEDALALINVSNVMVEYSQVNPFVFEPAVSPHIAAEQAGIDINCDVIKDNFNLIEKKADVVVVEGVGGWYAPLSHHTTVADLAEILRLPVILVVGIRLGCLNHALLTAQAIRQSGLPVAGWIANHVEKDFSATEKNISTLKHFLHDFPFLGSVPFSSSIEQFDQKTSKIENKMSKHHLNKTLLIDYFTNKK